MTDIQVDAELHRASAATDALTLALEEAAQQAELIKASVMADQEASSGD